MTTSAPFFIVGCPRSGTTLLRLMLTSHPNLAVPPESFFIVELAPRPWRRHRIADVEDVLAHRRVQLWQFDRDLARQRCRDDPPSTHAELVDRVYSAYASHHGKRRWGDKTPMHVEYLPFLARLFPDARFVHIIRDGREVAVSLTEHEWGPDDAVAGAFWWVNKVRRGRADGARLGPDRYAEVRLDELAAQPRETLSAVCRFLDEQFDESMLNYPASVEPHLARPHANLLRPPTPGLRDWRSGLTPATQAAVEAVCAPLLKELGYAVGRRDRAGLRRAWTVRGELAARAGPAAVTARLRPWTRR